MPNLMLEELRQQLSRLQDQLDACASSISGGLISEADITEVESLIRTILQIVAGRSDLQEFAAQHLDAAREKIDRIVRSGEDWLTSSHAQLKRTANQNRARLAYGQASAQ